MMSSLAIKPEPELPPELTPEQLEPPPEEFQEEQSEEIEAEFFRGWPSQLKLPLRDLNPILTCPLCAGYIISATRIIDCFHVFCKSCILTHLARTRTCPQCDIPVSEPFLSLRVDKDFQHMVYKLVPGLEANEAARQQAFIEDRERREAEGEETEEAEEEEEEEQEAIEEREEREEQEEEEPEGQEKEEQEKDPEEGEEVEETTEISVVEVEKEEVYGAVEEGEDEEELDVVATSEPEEKVDMEAKEEEEEEHDFPVVLCLEPLCPFLKNPTAFYSAASVRQDVFLLPLAQKFVRCSSQLSLRHVAAGLRKALRAPPDVSITFVRNRAHVMLSTRLAELTRPRGAVPLLLKYRGLRRHRMRP